MRPETQARIDALHAQIAELVAAEKAHHDAEHPSENRLHRNISHNAIEVAAWSQQDKREMGLYQARRRLGNPAVVAPFWTEWESCEKAVFDAGSYGDDIKTEVRALYAATQKGGAA